MSALIALAFLLSAQSDATGVVATARGAPPPPSTATSAAAPAPARIDDHPDGELVEVIKVGPCTPHGAEIAAEARAQGVRVEPDHSPHGEVGVGIGSRGAREAHGTVCQPIGDRGAVVFSASQSRGPRGGW